MSPVKYFVAGGSGFVGRHLLLRLLADGHVVRALVWSEEAARVVAALGAAPVRGDLTGLTGRGDELWGVGVVVHAEANESGRSDAAHVALTRDLLDAARAAGVRRFVHVSSDAVLDDGRPVRYVDETAPYPARHRGEHARTMALAEQTVLASDSREMRTVALRPRLVWGPGDTVLPRIIAAAQRGRWGWAHGGSHLTSTCHVRNLCEGIVLASRRGRGGQAYFLTDGPPVELRDFVARCAEAYGVELPDRTVPYPVTRTAASVMDTGWRVLPLKGEPPAAAVSLGVHEVTVDDTRARTELRYVPVVGVDEGIAELAEERSAAGETGGGS